MPLEYSSNEVFEKSCVIVCDFRRAALFIERSGQMLPLLQFNSTVFAECLGYARHDARCRGYSDGHDRRGSCLNGAFAGVQKIDTVEQSSLRGVLHSGGTEPRAGTCDLASGTVGVTPKQ